MKDTQQIIFAFFILAFFGSAATTFGQSVKSAVCPDMLNNSHEPANIIVTICSHESGMVSMIQPRLYLRLFTNGRMEFETGGSNFDSLSLIEMNVDMKEVEAISKLIRQPDFQNANAEYPKFENRADSSLKLTIAAQTGGQDKKIVVNNFSTSDKDNKKNYPPALLALLEKVAELNIKTFDEISKFWAENPPIEKVEPQIFDYEGTLEEGKTYRGIVYSNNRQLLSFAVPLKVPFHHADRVEWVNQAKFFFLDENRIVFQVKFKDTKQMTPTRWNTTYSCEILNLEESRTDRSKVKTRKTINKM
jgi:hypothetical protein